MDTSDLSAKTYRAIMIEAERFNPDLTLEFGLLSDECKDEETFIRSAEKLTRQMLRYNRADLDEMFFGNPPAKTEFHEALNRILENITQIAQSQKKKSTWRK